MFFEGRRSYHRIAKFFQLYIYKSILFTMGQLYFGFYNFWSGIFVFDGWYIYVNNILFSVMSLTWIGVLDWDIIYQKLESIQSYNKKL